MLVSRTPPALAASTECPASPVAPVSAASPAVGGCAASEEAEALLEEELEVREDEEEERAIAAERAAREAADASEEAAEESREAAAQEATASRQPSGAKVALSLAVSVSARHRGLRGRRGVTRLSATTSAPAQLRIVLRTAERPAKRFQGHTDGRAYTLRVPWNCRGGPESYAFVVRAYAEIEGRVGTRTGAAIVRRGSFTVDPRGVCEQRAA
jgi:hypothetical protein